LLACVVGLSLISGVTTVRYPTQIEVRLVHPYLKGYKKTDPKMYKLAKM